MCFGHATFLEDARVRKLTIAPGPNNPVGLVWIDLTAPSYGIHGTPEPDTIGKTESHGCIRLTNRDAVDLATMVHHGTVKNTPAGASTELGLRFGAINASPNLLKDILLLRQGHLLTTKEQVQLDKDVRILVGQLQREARHSAIAQAAIDAIVARCTDS
jgi:L,D-transpeptidase catalytic domain